MDERVGLYRKLSAEELMLLVLEKTLESSLDCKEITPVNPRRNQSWLFIRRTDAEELTHWNRPLCWERLKVGGEGEDRRWGGWMTSPTRWIWALSKLWEWWTGKPGVLQSMGSQRIGHNWAMQMTPPLWQKVKRNYKASWWKWKRRVKKLA